MYELLWQNVSCVRARPEPMHRLVRVWVCMCALLKHMARLPPCMLQNCVHAIFFASQGHITICCNCINSSFYFLHKEQEYLRGDYINTNSGIGLFIFTPHWLNILCIMKKVFLAKWITRLEHVKWLLRLCISQLLTANHSHFTYTIFFILTDHKYVARQG